MSEAANHNIQGFILQSLQGPLNDPNNSSYWLPDLLKNLKQGGKPVLPIKIDALDIGAMQGSGAEYIASTIAGSWAITENVSNPKVKFAIPNPAASLPTMKMTSLTVEGLDNIYVVSSSTVPKQGDTGYESTILAQFNTYDSTKVAHTLTVTGSFDLHQEVCSSKTQDSKKCDGTASATVIGHGTFTAEVGNDNDSPTPCFVSVVADVTISGAGSNRTPTVEIKSITPLGAGQTGEPSVYFSEVTLTNVQPKIKAEGLAAQIQFQLNTGSQGSNAVVTMIQDQLNTTDKLNSFSTMLTNVLSDALDSFFGPVGPSGLPSDQGQQIPNPVDEYYFDRIRAALNNPSGPYYVPTVVRSSTGPVLEPFQPGTIDLPDMTLPPPLDTVTLTQVTLETVKIVGLSNALIPSDQMSLDSGVLSAKATMNALSNPPAGTPKPPVTATAEFKAYAGEETGWLGPSPTTITVSSTAGQTTATTELTASGDKVDDLVLTFSSLVLSAVALDIDINIQTGSGFNHLINKVVNQGTIKQKALDGINSYIAGDLTQISQEATKATISLIKSKLDES